MSDPAITRQRRERVADYTRHPGSIWIDEHRSTPPNNEWVASNGSKLVAQSASIDGLMDALESNCVNFDEVAIAYISKDSV